MIGKNKNTIAMSVLAIISLAIMLFMDLWVIGNLLVVLSDKSLAGRVTFSKLGYAIRFASLVISVALLILNMLNLAGKNRKFEKAVGMVSVISTAATQFVYVILSLNSIVHYSKFKMPKEFYSGIVKTVVLFLVFVGLMVAYIILHKKYVATLKADQDAQ